MTGAGAVLVASPPVRPGAGTGPGTAGIDDEDGEQSADLVACQRDEPGWAYPLVADLPALPAVVLSEHIGWFGSWALTIAALVAVALVSRVVQARRNPPPVDVVPTARGAARIVRGAWPTLAGAVVLAVLGAGVLVVSGGAWGITSAFGLWGAKLLQTLGLHPETWAFWQQPAQAKMLAGPVLADKTSLTDFGIMIGAGIAAASAGVWVLHRSIRWRTALAAVIGGIIMGVGARLASGCNIGAYLAGGIRVRTTRRAYLAGRQAPAEARRDPRATLEVTRSRSCACGGAGRGRFRRPAAPDGTRCGHDEAPGETPALVTGSDGGRV